MIVNAEPAGSGAVPRRGQPPNVAPVVVGEEQRHVVGNAHTLVVVVLHLLVERPELRRLRRWFSGDVGDDPSLIGHDALEQRDIASVGHRQVTIAPHADRDDVLA